MSNEKTNDLSELRGTVTVKQLKKAVANEAVIKAIADALPADLKVAAHRYTVCLINEFQRNPQLAKCTGLSLINCMFQAAQFGLEIGGLTGQAYIVPYGNQAQFQVGYRGLIQLAFRSGQVETFTAQTVYENDHFKVRLGTAMELEHELPPVGTERGKAIAYYAMCKTKDGGHDFEVMTVEDVQAHAAKYSKTYNRSDSPHKTAPDEMGKKTPIRRLAKRVPLSIEFVRAAVQDEYHEAGIIEGPSIEIPGITDISQTDELAGDFGMSDDERGEI